ncbi:CHAP domain-containing protein [Bifidobacterium tsurumiense]|nr:CHAP domain-containing protein [Bifidobacterium tsurumiense]
MTRVNGARRRLASIAAIVGLILTVGGCGPLDVLAFLAGCRSASGEGASGTVQASAASGEWTGLVGMAMGRIQDKWPEHSSYCSTYGPDFQCTWWACMRERSLGHQVGQYWGNGNQWDTSAQQAGWVQGAQAGGIVSFEGGVVYGGIPTSALYGHVAVVEQVDGDTVHITEGGTGFGKVHATTLSASNPPRGVTYWHPADGSGTDGVPHGGAAGQGEAAAAWTCGADSADVMVDYEGDGVHAAPAEAQSIARQMIASGYKEWDNENDWQALVWIWDHESGWRWNADNPTSDAYGIPQALPGSKMASAGADWKDNAATQIKWGLDYIKGRYGSPGRAKQFWLAHNWY